jgi:hypothetical protein
MAALPRTPGRLYVDRGDNRKKGTPAERRRLITIWFEGENARMYRLIKVLNLKPAVL